jgi:hypothetical protein
MLLDNARETQRMAGPFPRKRPRTLYPVQIDFRRFEAYATERQRRVQAVQLRRLFETQEPLEG